MNHQKNKILIANWKMNPPTEEEAVRLARDAVSGVADFENVEIVIAPPFIFLETVARELKNIAGVGKPGIALSAQDVLGESEGVPRIGEISSVELKSLGVEYIIVGHSERRALGETDEMVGKKLWAVLDVGINPVLCVGEPRKVRDKGIDAAKQYVKKQLEADLERIKNQELRIKNNLIVAYEPVWAISTQENSQPDNPENAVQMIKFIKEFLTSSFAIPDPVVLYGGSTNAQNISGFMRQTEIDGALVGRASLDIGEFIEMVKIAASNHC